MAMIDRTEFRDAVHLIREDIRAVQTRLDVLNGRTRTTSRPGCRVDWYAAISAAALLAA